MFTAHVVVDAGIFERGETGLDARPAGGVPERSLRRRAFDLPTRALGARRPRGARPSIGSPGHADDCCDRPTPNRHPAAAARPRAGGRRRVPRPGQRGEQRQRRVALRVSAGLGGRGRQHHGVADPVPVGETRSRPPARVCRDCSAIASARRPARYAYWVQAELVAMATDIAEVLGGAIALQPAVQPAAHRRRHHHRCRVTAAARAARPPRLACFRTSGHRAGGDHRDRVHAPADLFAPVDGAAAIGGLVPRFTDSGSVLLAASILGATVMPHAIYAHSALTRDRFGASAEGIDRRTRAARDPASM